MTSCQHEHKRLVSGAAPAMNQSTDLRKTPDHGSPLPTTIWLPDTDEPNTTPIPGCVLPAWAIDKIRTDFVGRPDHLPVPRAASPSASPSR
jgi:hypothetical protein